MTDWQPIETAPRDGTVILFLTEESRVESGCWVDAEILGSDAGWLSGSGWTMPGRSFGDPRHHHPPIDPPTHWMPLPAPPVALPDGVDCYSIGRFGQLP